MKCEDFYSREVTLTTGLVVLTPQGLYKIGDNDAPVTLTLGDAIAMLTKLRAAATQFSAAAVDLQRFLDARLLNLDVEEHTSKVNV